MKNKKKLAGGVIGLVLLSLGLACPASAQRARRSEATGEPTPLITPVELPSPRDLFRLETDQAFRDRVVKETQRPGQAARTFPPEKMLPGAYDPVRSWPLIAEFMEPNYVCRGRLLFEEKNSERHGWDLGIVQPFVSAGTFSLDVAKLPYSLAIVPFAPYECSAGYCLPGDPVPYLFYCPGK
jgi:hypothetical protein